MLFKRNKPTNTPIYKQVNINGVVIKFFHKGICINTIASKSIPEYKKGQIITIENKSYRIERFMNFYTGNHFYTDVIVNQL